MRKWLVAAALVVAGLFVTLAVYVNSDSIFWGWTSSNIQASKAKGAELIEKIELYRKENGRLPTQLDELVPRYISSVPAPLAGERRWNYNLTGDGNTFYLGFSMPNNATWGGYPSCGYESQVNQWHVDE
jgi:hypothetical protein